MANGFARVPDHDVLGVPAQPRARQRLRLPDGLNGGLVHRAVQGGQDRLALGLDLGREF